jgi:hypothetical protein
LEQTKKIKLVLPEREDVVEKGKKSGESSELESPKSVVEALSKFKEEQEKR